ncbi:hypothetical protein PsalN5692_02682 [Piscirickettsia salmonis]|uniref:DNA replication terminus site-binding protein n=1 Tax=Piscirickettsia salmonis TaxID=1238 RepID=UPI0012B6F240|nr:DNA replication terminus site-binding family protein [Piscirickettsia salmonis]QGP51201.1 hypothetical protein PsalN5692_02682 [Piscirickettsia salmonis]QGP53601.1 hypothetical protein PsalSR1_01015 [Piscirickettsia salmonis]QGP60483.1 hypothetical protein PsalBI1_03098 [Piscirickettsia salmonis]QGP63172.1 hypothetical protein PsalMR5_01019 [Piscirickettsia salmonis]
MTLEAELRIDVINSYEALTHALSALKVSIDNDQHLPSWVEDHSATPRQTSYQAISQLEYLSDQPPKETLLYTGLIGASSHTLDCAKHVNQTKEQFKQAMLALKAAKVAVHDPILLSHFERHLQERSANTRASLQKMGLARLHLKQCYRKIPILDERPQKISWTWAHTRAIKRLSAADCIILLQKKGKDPGILQQLERAKQLHTDTPLAIIQELAPHLRANVVFAKGQSKNRIMLKAPLPVFYPHQVGDTFPQIKAAGSKQPKNPLRAQRTDVKIDPEPFLPAIRAHRYLR